MRPNRRLVEDGDVLDRWTEHASQAERNMVYDALFALVDDSAAKRYHLRAADGRYRIAVGLDLMVRGRLANDTFSVAAIDRWAA